MVSVDESSQHLIIVLVLVILTALGVSLGFVIILVFIVIVILVLVLAVKLQTVVILELLERLDNRGEAGCLEALFDSLVLMLVHVHSKIRNFSIHTSSNTVAQVMTMLAVLGANIGKRISRRAPLI